MTYLPAASPAKCRAKRKNSGKEADQPWLLSSDNTSAGRFVTRGIYETSGFLTHDHYGIAMQLCIRRYLL